MSTSPRYWNQVIDSQQCVDLDDFMNAVKYHEDALTGSYSGNDSNLERRIRQLEASLGAPRPTGQFRPRHNFCNLPLNANTNLVGYHPSIGSPPFPRDDTVVSKGQSPEDVGARPCRHCGSPKHWDYECSHARKGAKQVK